MNEASHACGVCVHVEGRPVDEQIRVKHKRKQYHTDCVATVITTHGTAHTMYRCMHVVAVPPGGFQF